MAGQANVCRFYPTASGTTDWTYSGFITGYQSPTNAGAIDGKIYHIRSESADLNQWELSEGAYTAATGVFARTTILYNSSGTGTRQSGAGTKINFSTLPQVAVVGLAEDTRERLTANLTLYVRLDGDDTHSGLLNTAAGALRTMQKACDIQKNNYDVGNFAITIQVADGTTWSDPVSVNGGGPYNIVGNTGTPANVVHAVVGTVNFRAKDASLTVSGFELRNLTGHFAELHALDNGIITWTNMRFGTTDGDNMQADGGKIYGSGAYSIVGNMASHCHSFNHGLIQIANFTCTLVGTPAIAAYFVGANDATVEMFSSTFVGTATGPRFLIHFGGIFTSNGTISLTGLPGNVAGTMDTSALYDTLYIPDSQGGIAYSPTITSQTVGGTPATYTPGAIRYKMLSGKFCFAYGTVAVTNQGVGNSGGIVIGLPFPAAAGLSFPGDSFEFFSTGFHGSAFVGSGGTTMNCKDANAVSYIVTGKGISFGVLYETA